MTIQQGTKGLITNPSQYTCPDCGMTHTTSTEDHNMFCEAKTCTVCLNTYENVIQADDSGDRVCTSCRHEMDSGDVSRDGEESATDGEES